MPKNNPDLYRSNFKETDPLHYSVEFKKYLNSFNGKDLKNPDGDYMTKEEKDCWDLYKGNEKTSDDSEDKEYTSTTVDDITSVNEWEYLKNPLNVSGLMFTPKWLLTETTEMPDGTTKGNSRIWNFVQTQIKESVAMIDVPGIVAAIAEKKYQEAAKKAEDNEKENEDGKSNEDMQEKVEGGKDKTVVVEQEKDGSSRMGPYEEQMEEENDLEQGVVSGVNLDEVERTREEFGMVEKQPEELTNFKSQEAEGPGLEQTLEEQAVLRKD